MSEVVCPACNGLKKIVWYTPRDDSYRSEPCMECADGSNSDAVEIERLRFALKDIAQHSLEKYAVDVASNALSLTED